MYIAADLIVWRIPTGYGDPKSSAISDENNKWLGCGPSGPVLPATTTVFNPLQSASRMWTKADTDLQPPFLKHTHTV